MPPKGKKRGPKPGIKTRANATVVKVCLDTNQQQSLNNLTNMKSESQSNYTEDQPETNYKVGPTKLVITQPHDDSSEEIQKEISVNKRRRGRPSYKTTSVVENPIKRVRKKLKRDVSDEDLNDSEQLDFEDDNMYMNSDNEYSNNEKKMGKESYDEDSEENIDDEDSYMDFEDEENFLTSDRNKKLSMMQSTTYLSKRLTKRQKAVQKKTNTDNTDEEDHPDLNNDEIYNEVENDTEDVQYAAPITEENQNTASFSNQNLKVSLNPNQPYIPRETRGNKKKKKNILTQEEKTRKIEMEEKRRAHLARLSEEHKQQIVNKILNENKRNKTGMITEYQKKLTAREGRLQTRAFKPEELITKHRYDAKMNYIYLPRGLPFKSLLDEEYDTFFANQKSGYYHKDSPQRKLSVGSNSHGNLLVIRKNSSYGTPKKSLRKDSIDTKPEQITQDFKELNNEWPLTCCINNCDKARKYKIPMNSKKDSIGKRLSACSFECYKKLKGIGQTTSGKSVGIVC